MTLTTGGKLLFAAGESVPATAMASCAVGDSPQYRFDYRLDGAGGYVPIRDWQSAPSVQWDTTTVHSGKYLLRVTARAGSSGTEVSRSATVWIGDVCNTLSGSASAAQEPPPLGMPVTVTAMAGCTGGTAEYKIFYRAATDPTWTTLSDWGSNGTAQLNTGTPGFRSRNYQFTRGASAGDTVLERALSLAVRRCMLVRRVAA